MSSPDRFDGLVDELRASKPTAPPELRERVGQLELPPRRTTWTIPRISVRRAAVVLVPACLVAAVGAALIHGVANSGSKSLQKAAPGGFTTLKKVHVGANR